MATQFFSSLLYFHSHRGYSPFLALILRLRELCRRFASSESDRARNEFNVPPFVSHLPWILRDTGSWNSVLGCSSTQVLYLISIFCDLDLPLIWIFNLMVFNSCSSNLCCCIDQSESLAGVTKREGRKEGKERSQICEMHDLGNCLPCVEEEEQTNYLI